MPISLKHERRVFQWYIKVQPFPKEAINDGKCAILEDAIGILETAVGLGRARIFLGEGSRILDDDDFENRVLTNQIYIADIRRSSDGGFVTILINRGDPHAVTPAFLNAAENSVRLPRVGPQETQGWSAHLVIAMHGKGGSHRACFEQVPHVPSSTVITAFDRIVSRQLDGNPEYTFEHITYPRGRRQIDRRPYRPRIDMVKVPSDSLMEDIKDGVLKSIVLVKKKEEYRGIGEDPLITRAQNQIVLSIAPENDKGRIATLVRSIHQQARQAADIESISFRVENLPGDRRSTPSIAVDDENALEQLFVRSMRLDGFMEDLEQCYSKTCDAIEEKMVTVLARNALWE